MSSPTTGVARRKSTDRLSIGEVARRSGLAPSTLRFYESRELIRSERTAGGRRLYRRHVLRPGRIHPCRQGVGLTLAEIEAALARLPADRAPTRAEWEGLSRGWRKQLDERIETLERLRDELTGCIGCLSLRRCQIYNRGDTAASLGTGPRYLLGDSPADVAPER